LPSALPPFSRLLLPRPPSSTLFPYTTLFRSGAHGTRAALRFSARSARERILQVSDQVLDVLDTDRQADQRVVDTERLALLGRNRRMRHQARMVDETLDAAQTFRDREQAQALQHLARLVQPALHEERHDTAETVAHLLLRERVLRMAR